MEQQQAQHITQLDQEEIDEQGFFNNIIDKITLFYRNKIDPLNVFIKTRWSVTAFLLLLYCLRIFSEGGFYVVSYIFGLYILHLAVQFFTPIGLPDVEEDDDNDDEEAAEIVADFKQEGEDASPLIRAMNEFKFWQHTTCAAILAFICTFFDICNLPVYWPFLLGYFVVLGLITVRRQIRHMTKYQYSFFDFNKKPTK